MPYTLEVDEDSSWFVQLVGSFLGLAVWSPVFRMFFLLSITIAQCYHNLNFLVSINKLANWDDWNVLYLQSTVFVLVEKYTVARNAFKVVTTTLAFSTGKLNQLCLLWGIELLKHLVVELIWFGCYCLLLMLSSYLLVQLCNSKLNVSQYWNEHIAPLESIRFVLYKGMVNVFRMVPLLFSFWSGCMRDHSINIVRCLLSTRRLQ